MNDNELNTKIIAVVATSGILDPHRSHDTCLDELLTTMSTSPSLWQTQPAIAVSSSHTLPASHFEKTFRNRLELIPHRSDTESLRIAPTQLVDYCAVNHEARICGVTVNCPKRSYTIFCGQLDERVDVICVMVGKHISEYALGQR